jgi:hypothetical protein
MQEHGKQSCHSPSMQTSVLFNTCLLNDAASSAASSHPHITSSTTRYQRCW